MVGAAPHEIIFTSGATEADNLAIKGVVGATGQSNSHVVTVTTEHPAILDSCAALEKGGTRISYLKVDSDGRIESRELDAAMDNDTILVSVMTVNNETGVIQNIEEIGALCRQRGIRFHTDAVQAIGKIPFHVDKAKVDLASITAHKMYGPKGVGALYIRDHSTEHRMHAQMDGGGHEQGMRSGTLNVPGIVGLGAAAELVNRELEEEMLRLAKMRQQIEEALFARLPGTHINGHPEYRVPGTMNLSFDGCRSDELISVCTQLAFSSGAACHAGLSEPSPVLKAMGLETQRALGAIRLSLGRFSTQEHVELAIRALIGAVESIRRSSIQ